MDSLNYRYSCPFKSPDLTG